MAPNAINHDKCVKFKLGVRETGEIKGQNDIRKRRKNVLDLYRPLFSGTFTENKREHKG